MGFAQLAQLRDRLRAGKEQVLSGTKSGHCPEAALVTGCLRPKAAFRVERLSTKAIFRLVSRRLAQKDCMNVQLSGRADRCPGNLRDRAPVILQVCNEGNDDAKEPLIVIRLISTLGRDV